MSESTLVNAHQTEEDGVECITGFASDANQVLTFRLETEEYGIDILRVQEIRNYSNITPIPNTPDYIKGAMNLRGTVVPVIDLRNKFSLPETDYDQFTVIIVINVGDRIVGVVVDAVSDVVSVRDEDFAPPPQFGSGVDTSFINGIVKNQDRLITLLNVESLAPGPAAQEAPAPVAI